VIQRTRESVTPVSGFFPCHMSAQMAKEWGGAGKRYAYAFKRRGIGRKREQQRTLRKGKKKRLRRKNFISESKGPAGRYSLFRLEGRGGKKPTLSGDLRDVKEEIRKRTLEEGSYRKRKLIKFQRKT